CNVGRWKLGTCRAVAHLSRESGLNVFRFRPPIYILATFEFRKSCMRCRKNSRAKLPIQVRLSRVHGRGVFATQAIRKNACVIEYTGKRVPWESVPVDSDDAHAFLFGLDDSTLVIDPSIDGND